LNHGNLDNSSRNLVFAVDLSEKETTTFFNGEVIEDYTNEVA